MLRHLKQTASETMRTDIIHITAPRLHHSIATTQYHPSRSVISMRGIPTRADVFPLNKEFLRNSSALRARLRRISRINFDNLNSGTRSLEFETLKELAPASIQHRTGKTVIPRHPFDVQAFHCYHPVLVNQLTSESDKGWRLLGITDPKP